MRVWCIVLPVIAIAVTPYSVRGQDGADAAKAAAALKQMMAKFDANGDGKFDDEEREKAAETIKKQFKEGKLPPQEAAMLKAMMSQLQNGGGLPQFGPGAPGGRDGAGAGGSP